MSAEMERVKNDIVKPTCKEFGFKSFSGGGHAREVGSTEDNTPLKVTNNAMDLSIRILFRVKSGAGPFALILKTGNFSTDSPDFALTGEDEGIRDWLRAELKKFGTP
jgi:hypothetical protein